MMFIFVTAVGFMKSRDDCLKSESKLALRRKNSVIVLFEITLLTADTLHETCHLFFRLFFLVNRWLIM